MNVTPLPLPWLELSIVTAVLGALWVSPIRDPLRAWRWGLLFTGAALLGTLLACLSFYVSRWAGVEDGWGFQTALFGASFLAIDELNAPLLPVIGLLHFLTALATGRTKMRRFSLSWSLTSEAVRLALFGCTAPWVLVGLLCLGPVPGYVELVNRGQPTRVYVLHMGLFAALLILGWAFIDPRGGHETQTALATVPLLAALLIRCGSIPAHCWVTDWCERASFGNALLFLAPLPGVYAAVRLVLPIAPDWLLQGIGIVSLVTAVYASGMALVQQDARRFFAYLFLSHASLVLLGLELVGLEPHASISLTGALALWVSVSLSLGGFGLTLRALEARFGRLSLRDFRGLYDHSPALAVCFVLTGLAMIGFPGTLGFVATELLVDGAIEANPLVGLGVAVVAMLNGIAVVRAYFYLFTGTRYFSSVSLGIGMRERLAVFTLTALILGGGIYPQPGIASRHRAASAVLRERETRGPTGRMTPRFLVDKGDRFHE